MARVQSAEASHKLVDPVIIIYDNLSSIKTGADGLGFQLWVEYGSGIGERENWDLTGMDWVRVLAS